MSTDARVTPQSFVDLTKCSHCLRPPLTVRTLLDPRTGRSVRMFECECGENSWQELPKDQGRADGD